MKHSCPTEFIYLRIDNKTFKIRRSILTNCSRYFKELLKFQPSNCVVTLDNIKFNTFDLILKWLHTHELPSDDLNLSIVIEIFNTSVQFQITELTNVCERVITKKLLETDMRDIFALTDQDGTTDVFHTIHTILTTSFETIVKTPNFLKFNVDFVCMLLSDNNIKITNEKVVFDAALQWLNFNWSNRKKYTMQVMSCVRFQLLTKQDLLLLSLRSSEFYALEAPEVRKMFLDGFRYHAALKGNQISCFPDLIPEPRTRLLQNCFQVPPQMNDNQYGGTSEMTPRYYPTQIKNVSEEAVQTTFSQYDTRTAIPTLEGYCTPEPTATTQATPKSTSSIQSRTEREVRKMKQKSQSNLARCWGSSPMCTSRKPLTLSRLLKYFPNSNKREIATIAIQSLIRGWQVRRKLKAMNEAARIIQMTYRKWRTKKREEAAASHENLENVHRKSGETFSRGLALEKTPIILVIGGVDPGHKPLATASTILGYDPRENKWQPVLSTPVPFVQCACSKLGQNVYITGGIVFKKHSNSVRNSTWSLNTATSEWCQCGDMLETRACHSLISHCDKLFAIGGKNCEDKILESVEFYEPGLDRWFKVSSMHFPRMAMAAEVYKDHIWVCGGATTDSKTFSVGITATVECFNFSNNVWCIQPTLQIPRVSSMLIPSTGDNIVIVGGATENTVNVDGEIYNPSKHKWRVDERLNISRESAPVVRLFDLTFLIGGYSMELKSVLSSVLCFLPGLNDKADFVADLPYPLNGHCAVAVDPLF